MGKVTVLVGMIASGKSTYAREQAKQGAVVVNDDAIVMAVHGGDYKLYRETLKPLYKAVEREIAETAILLDKDVVIDNTNLSKQTRQRWLTFARTLDVPCVCIHFRVETAEEHARRRFEADARGYSLEQWTQVARRHLKEYDFPYADEGFTQVIYR